MRRNPLGIVTPAALQQRVTNRRCTAHGRAGEAMVRARLLAMGYRMVEHIETGWRVHRVGARIVGASPAARVSGDFRAIAAGGISVLVEAKWRDCGQLSWSDLEDHQHAAMVEHANLGGISLVALVNEAGVRICGYGYLCDAGWKPRHPIPMDHPAWITEASPG